MMEFLTGLLYPISFVLVLSIIVIVHEAGHFAAARLSGVKVEEFSVGFGKILWSRKDKKDTLWKVCLLPLGGYVKMFGDADAASTTKNEEAKEFTEEEKKVAFPYQPLYKKAFIAVAGPTMNYVFAIVILGVFLSIFGAVVVPPVISDVAKDSAAEKAGIIKNDEIIRINDVEIKEFDNIRRMVQLDSILNIVVLRDGKEVPLTAHLTKETGGAVLGVQAMMTKQDFKSLSIPQAFGQATMDAWQMTVDTVVVLKRIIMQERSADDMRGPLGIAEASGDAAKQGVLSFVLFLAQISIGIGFVNLLPIPVLDGGHLMFYTIEAITRRPVNEKVQNFALNIGIGLLLCLLILTSWNDIVRIFLRLFQ